MQELAEDNVDLDVIPFLVNVKYDVISTIKGLLLVKPEMREITVILRRQEIQGAPDDVLKALVNAAIRQHLVETVAMDIRSNRDLKRKIGGIRWSIRLWLYSFRRTDIKNPVATVVTVKNDK